VLVRIRSYSCELLQVDYVRQYERPQTVKQLAAALCEFADGPRLTSHFEAAIETTIQKQEIEGPKIAISVRVEPNVAEVQAVSCRFQFDAVLRNEL
jgi:hypothetical protein